MKLSMILVLCFFLTSILRSTDGDEETTNLPQCDYSALFNFGDSNSDTGGISATFYQIGSPAGQTYFHQPSGRASDGRLIIDFIAENVGIPYLSSYLDSLGSNYQKGANFATGGATIQKTNESWFVAGVSPFPLEIQVQQYIQLKVRSPSLYNQTKNKCERKRLPKPDLDFSKALFTLDIGQNDVTFGLRTLSYEVQKTVIPDVVSQFITQIGVLYERGARTFWIHNTGPIGCLPFMIARVQNQAPGNLDEIGCVKSSNDVALLFNKVLKEEIVKLRENLTDAAIVYVDMYAAKYELISKAKSQGFENPLTACCGHYGNDSFIYCGSKGIVFGTEVTASSCADPSKAISWDGVHYTEAANQWIANRIANGSLSDPPIPVSRACHKKT